MSESRCHLVVLLGLVIAAAGPAALFCRPVRTSPCLASFGRVKAGMTRGDVAARLGAPPVSVTVPQDELFGVRSWEEWVGPDGECVLGFGPDGRVRYCRVNPRPVPEATPLRHVRDRSPVWRSRLSPAKK